MKNIVTVVGARPQFIKASPVSRALKEAGLAESIIHTGQHSDSNMSQVFFDELNIPKPDHFLQVNGLTHGAMTGEMLKNIERILISTKPDLVLVYGDTNSTLAGALAASKLHLPVAHIEAGLRSFNMKMPEEINRTLTDRISHWLFCPTATAVKNLKDENFRSPQFQIQNVGDVMLDATVYFKDKARWPTSVPIEFQSRPFLLCTLHRQELTDNRDSLTEVLKALKSISEEIPVIWPMHPRAKKMLNSFELETSGIMRVPPVGYLEMLALLEACEIVATDSGGLQKEAFFFSKHCLTLRRETEWTELVDIGANSLCGTSYESILSNFRKTHQRPSNFNDIYGSGSAAKTIAHTLRDA